MALCNEPLQELSNAGASGSLFYVTNDDEFIIKTVQHKEADFLQKLLPGYYLVRNKNIVLNFIRFGGNFCDFVFVFVVVVVVVVCFVFVSCFIFLFSFWFSSLYF